MRPFVPTILSTALLLSCTASRKTGAASVAAPPSEYENVLIARALKKDLYGPCEPSICINLKNPTNLAAGAVLDRYYWSEDGGRNWNSAQLRTSYGVFGDPVLLSTAAGTMYYAHLSDPSGEGWGSEPLLDRIVVQKSTDGGRSYDDGSYLGLNPPKDQDKHWLAADPNSGALYCTWTEFDVYGSNDRYHDRSRIRFSASTDGGAQWTEAITISQFDGDCEDDDNTPEGAVPAVGPKGEVYVAWSNSGKIWFDRSLDGGKTWLDKDILIAEQPGGWSFDIEGITRCNGMPVLVCDLSDGPNRGALYVNWADQRNGDHDTDIFVAKSTDGGANWSKPVRVNNDKKGHQQFLTWMAIDQTTGYLYTVFYDRRAYTDERTDVYLAVSRDGGRSFENFPISKEPFDPSKMVFFGDYNHIAAHAGIVRPIWTRMDNGVLSVWTAILDFKTPAK